MAATVTTPRRSTARLPSRRFPVYTRFQNAMEAFRVSTEKGVADARLSPGIVAEEHPSVDTEELLRIYATPEAMIGVDAVVSALRGFCETALLPPFLAAISCPDLRSGIRRTSAAGPGDAAVVQRPRSGRPLPDTKPLYPQTPRPFLRGTAC
jgi:hypothetical protein